MITVEDLRNSLRAQLGALVDLYEQEIADSVTVSRGGARASDMAGTALPPAPPVPIAGLAEDDASRASRIEACLVDFDAALRAAARAEAVREATQSEALVALERSVVLQRDASTARRGIERALNAARAGTARRPRDAAATVERSRSAAHAADRAARGAEALARRRRQVAEAAGRAAMAALLAAIQADPSRGNPGFDPNIAGAARTLAERAARDAEALNGDAAIRDGRGVVIRLTTTGAMADDRTARDPTKTMR